jgi:hypothetical protein
MGVLEVTQRLVGNGTSRKEGSAVCAGAQLAMAQRAADSGLNSEMLQGFSQASGHIGARFRRSSEIEEGAPNIAKRSLRTGIHFRHTSGQNE